MFWKYLAFVVLVLAAPASLVADPVAKPRLAVLDLRLGKGVQADLGETVSELLRTAFVKTKQFDVVERAAVMRALVKEQAFQESGILDTEGAVRLGRLLGARKVLAGTLSILGGKYLLNASVIDMERGKIEIADTASAVSEQGLSRAADELAAKIVGHLTGEGAKRDMKPVMPFVWRSALFPGWGQLFRDGEDDRLRGGLFLTSGLLFAGIAYSEGQKASVPTLRLDQVAGAIEWGNHISNFLRLPQETRSMVQLLMMAEAIDTVESERRTYRDTSRTFVAAFALVYMWSLFDAIFTDPQESAAAPRRFHPQFAIIPEPSSTTGHPPGTFLAFRLALQF